MRRTPLPALGLGLVVVLMTAILVGRAAGTDPAVSAPPADAAATPRPGSVPDPTDPGGAGDVSWSVGPWGEVIVAGHRLLVPASPVHGPLKDLGDGWASDYAPTATGAAIALLRGPWFVFAAPAALRPQVVAAVLTRPPRPSPARSSPPRGGRSPASC